MTTKTYTYSHRNRICQCGVTLTEHTAEAPHTIDYPIKGIHHHCQGFEPADKQNRNRRTGQYAYKRSMGTPLCLRSTSRITQRRGSRQRQQIVDGVLTEQTVRTISTISQSQKDHGHPGHNNSRSLLPVLPCATAIAGQRFASWTMLEVEQVSAQAINCSACYAQFFIPSKEKQ